MDKLEALKISSLRPKPNILDRALSKGKAEVSLSFVALLFSEIVQYCQNRAYTVPEIEKRLHDLGQEVGLRFIDLYFVRERNSKRETKVKQMLLFIKTSVWKQLFGKEAEKLEHATDEDTYYIIETDPLLITYISVPKDKGLLHCASFTAGIVEAVLTNSGFVLHTIYMQLHYDLFYQLQPCKVSAHWHKGTTYMIKFDEEVIKRDKTLEDK